MSWTKWLRFGPGDLAMRMSVRVGVTVGLISSTCAVAMVLSALLSHIGEPYGTVSQTLAMMPVIAGACALPIAVLVLLAAAATLASRPRLMARLYLCTFSLTTAYLLPIIAVWSVAVASRPARLERAYAAKVPAWMVSPWMDMVVFPVGPMAGILVLVWASSALARSRDELSTRCLHCGYSLAGIEARVCPECGRTVL